MPSFGMGLACRRVIDHALWAWSITLQKLLGDDNEQVRNAAEGVWAALTTLKQTPTAQLADLRPD